MKKPLLFLLLVLLLAAGIPAAAQESTPAACDTDSVKAAVDGLIATYLVAKGNAADAASALQAAQDLQDGIAALTSGCAGVTPEATPETTSESSNVSAGGLAVLQQGKWMLTWNSPVVSCAAENYTATLANRPLIVLVKDDKVYLNDLFFLGETELSLDDKGHYTVLNTFKRSNGYAYTYTYTLETIGSDVVSGNVTDFFPGSACVSLRSDFKLTLLDANVICMVGSEQGANLRSGPGTTFDRLGKLNAKEPADVVGQATGDDGFVWWKLADGGWVRSDVVKEAGDCESVPQASA